MPPDDMGEAASVIADAIAGVFSVDDEEENVVHAVNRLARAVRDLGNADAATPMGGMEALGKAMQDSAAMIAGSLSDVARAIDRLADVR